MLHLSVWTRGSLDWYYRDRPFDPEFPRDELFSRLVSGVNRTHHPITGECWERPASRPGLYTTIYTGLLRPGGGSIMIGAHRLSQAIKQGHEITPGMMVIHSCHNPPCIRPDHIREGTAQDNADDRKLRLRSRWPMETKTPIIWRRP